MISDVQHDLVKSHSTLAALMQFSNFVIGEQEKAAVYSATTSKTKQVQMLCK
jgi:hypothetical protein